MVFVRVFWEGDVVGGKFGCFSIVEVLFFLRLFLFFVGRDI